MNQADSFIALERPLVFHPPAARATVPAVSTTPDIDALLAQNAVVAIGVSGGKDSQACAIAVVAHLDAIGHAGPRVLVHSDLGRVEWSDSITICEELAAHLGIDLMVVRRAAGDMMDRWLGRWKNNVQRYADLSCVKLILPWSTPSMRFCTSELKVAVITSALKKRFPGQNIVNATGVRREESTARQRMPVSSDQPKLKRKGAAGVNWNAIIELKVGEVLDSIASSGLRLHVAYTKYKASRVSCAFCIMSALEDLRAAASCEENLDLYVEMVELEAASSFAFQGNRWLADIAPPLLSDDLLERVAAAKKAAVRRQELEARIPDHLLYTKGWPTCMPTAAEAEIIAYVRREVAGLLALEISCITAESVLQRYGDLMALKDTQPDSYDDEVAP